MATIKNYTDIPQSRKLAELLSIESADIHYNVVGDAIIGDYQSGISSARSVAKAFKKNPDEFAKKIIPCWSLAALLEVLPKIHGLKPIVDLEETSIQYSGVDLYVIGENLVDACVTMIEKLHERNLL